jgi:hypothetical protein
VPTFLMSEIYLNFCGMVVIRHDSHGISRHK